MASYLVINVCVYIELILVLPSGQHYLENKQTKGKICTTTHKQFKFTLDNNTKAEYAKKYYYVCKVKSESVQRKQRKSAMFDKILIPKTENKKTCVLQKTLISLSRARLTSKFRSEEQNVCVPT